MVKLIDAVGREGVYKTRKNTRDNLLALKLSKRDVFCELEATKQVNLWNKGWHDVGKIQIGSGPARKGEGVVYLLTLSLCKEENGYSSVFYIKGSQPVPISGCMIGDDTLGDYFI